MLKFALDYDLVDRYQPPSSEKYSLSIIISFTNLDLISYCKRSDVTYPFPIYAGIGSLGKRQSSLFTYSGNSYEKANRGEIKPKKYYKAFLKSTKGVILRGSSINTDSTSASLHAKRIKTKIGSSITTKSFYNVQRCKRPSYDIITKKNHTISNYAFHRTIPSKTLNKHRATKYSNLAAKKLIPEAFKYYFASHLRKIDTYFNQDCSDKAIKSATIINDTIDVEESDKKLFASEQPKDLLILAKQVKEKAITLRKIDPISKHFHMDSKMSILIDHSTIYKGEILEDKKNGLGIGIFSDGRIYKGKWKDDAPLGKGIYQTNFGFTVIGEFDTDFNVTSTEAKFYVTLYPSS